MNRYKRIETVIKIVVAPNTWQCGKCGGVIRQGEECGKQGSQVICVECIKKGGKSGTL